MGEGERQESNVQGFVERNALGKAGNLREIVRDSFDSIIITVIPYRLNLSTTETDGGRHTFICSILGTQVTISARNRKLLQFITGSSLRIGEDKLISIEERREFHLNGLRGSHIGNEFSGCHHGIVHIVHHYIASVLFGDAAGEIIRHMQAETGRRRTVFPEPVIVSVPFLECLSDTAGRVGGKEIIVTASFEGK